MVTEEIECECNILSNSIEAPDEKPQVVSRPLFEQNLPVSLAEQFPRLVFGSVAFSILLAVITAEIDCLRGAGYYWP